MIEDNQLLALAIVLGLAAIIVIGAKRTLASPGSYAAAVGGGLIVAAIGASLSVAWNTSSLPEVLLLENTFGAGRAVPIGYGIALGSLILLVRAFASSKQKSL